MDHLSNPILSQILSHSRLEEQLVIHRLINSRFYHIMPNAVRLSHINVHEFQNLSAKIPTFSWPKIPLLKQMEIIERLFDYLIDLNGHRIFSIHFASEPPLKPEILQLLADECPNIKSLNLSTIPIELTLEHLQILPSFGKLRHLRLPKQVGAEFEPILAQLTLRTLQIGGENAPIITADNRKLRHLIISGVPPRAYMENVHLLADLFPNLKTHDMEQGREDSWRRQVYDQFKSQGESALDNYRRLTSLRYSRFIDDDPYLFPRTADHLSLSNYFSNLSRLIISLRDYNDENGDQNAPPWTRTVAVLPHLKRLSHLRIEGRNDYGPSAVFGQLVFHALALAPNLKILELQGRFPAWDRKTIDHSFTIVACQNRLRSLTLCGTNVECILEKFLESCPKLRKIDYTDEILALFAVDENSVRFAKTLADYGEKLGSKNMLRSLRLCQTVLGVYIANRVRESVNFIDAEALILLGDVRWPNLRELDIRIKKDKEAVAKFFSKMPNLRILKLEFDQGRENDGSMPPVGPLVIDRSDGSNFSETGASTSNKLNGILWYVLKNLSRLEELSISETKIDMDQKCWLTVCTHKNLRKFTCRLNRASVPFMDKALGEAVEERRKMIAQSGWQPPLLQAIIFDCPRGSRTSPLVGDGDALIDSETRLRIIIPDCPAWNERASGVVRIGQ